MRHVIYSDAAKDVQNFSGVCSFEWRQGVKHDCSKVMELSYQGDFLINGLKETIDIESKYVFPLIKRVVCLRHRLLPVLKDM